MIVKHVEYKIVCDKCYSDITDWQNRTRNEAVYEARKDGFKIKPNGFCLCEECQKEKEDEECETHNRP